MRRLMAIVLALGLSGAAAERPLRIAALGEEGPCAPAGPEVSPGERAYYAHLSQRLGRTVVRCPSRDRAAAALALAEGRVDLAVLDQASYGPVSERVRAFATVRQTNGLSRVPVVISRRAATPRDLDDLQASAIVFGGRSPAAYDLPKQALEELGARPSASAAEVVAADHETAVEALRAGRADLMVLHASAHRRLCRPSKPGDRPCDDLVELWRGRPRAEMAVAVRRDMPDLERYRLLGIHLAMHMEAKEGFRWAASWQPDAADFEPAEADALGPLR